MLRLDSNILIYASQPQQAALRRMLAGEALAVSVISKIEVLGFSRLDPEDARFFRALFERLWVIDVEPPIVESAIDLRQRRRMSLGDAIVAATALVIHCGWSRTIATTFAGSTACNGMTPCKSKSTRERMRPVVWLPGPPATDIPPGAAEESGSV